MSKEFLRKAVDLAGGQVALAAGIKARMPAGTKVSQAHIWKWLNRVKSVVPPGDYVVPIADSIGYYVTPHQLREDMYPNPTDGLPPEIAAQVVAGEWPPRAESTPRQSDHRQTEGRRDAAFSKPAARRSIDRPPRRRGADAGPPPEVRQSTLAFTSEPVTPGVAFPNRRKERL